MLVRFIVADGRLCVSVCVVFWDWNEFLLMYLWVVVMVCSVAVSWVLCSSVVPSAGSECHRILLLSTPVLR